MTHSLNTARLTLPRTPASHLPAFLAQWLLGLGTELIFMAFLN